jgi:hypothetical protein
MMTGRGSNDCIWSGKCGQSCRIRPSCAPGGGSGGTRGGIRGGIGHVV